MKPCKPQYEHIDQTEFGDGRKITTSLLTRFCNNISGLWKKTKQLENNTTPELRKTFTPPPIHDIHSYGMKLNTNNEYELDNSTETIFTDAIGLNTIEIQDLNRTEQTGKILYTKEFETTHNIAQIAINKTENTYPSQGTLETLKEANHGYYIDQNILYIKLAPTETFTSLLVTVHSDDPFIDRKLTTAHVNLAENKIHSPYSKEQFEDEVLDQNTAIQYSIGINKEEIATVRGVEKYWNFGWRRFNHFWMYPLWLQDPFSENPTTPPIPTVARAFIIKPRNTGLLTKIRLMFNVKNGAEDEAYIEIRTLTKEGFPSTKILAREKTHIRGTNQPILHTIPFNIPPFLNKGEKYAIVVRAGFTSSEKSYGLGGWSFATYGSEFLGNILHKAGSQIKGTQDSSVWSRINGFDEDLLSDVFHSTDNCVSWIKAHSISLAGLIEDSFDGMRPRAFSYQTFIKPLKPTQTLEQGESHVYWKPIKTNPITSVQLIPSMQGEGIQWNISTNMTDWHTLTKPHWNYNFQKDGDKHEQNQNQLYIHAKITTFNSQNKSSKPEITGLKAIITTKPAKNAYLKTLFYNPRLGNLQSPSLWSQIGTQTKITPHQTDQVDMEIDIIRNTIIKDTLTCNGHSMTFKLTEKPSQPLVNVTMLPSTLYLPTQDEQITPEADFKDDYDAGDMQKLILLQEILVEIDKTYKEIKQENNESYPVVMHKLAQNFANTYEIIQQLQCNKKSLSLLKKSTKPLKNLENCDKRECLLNYIVMLRNITINTMNLIKKPTSKYINILPSIPGQEDINLELKENRDYHVDYKKGTITLHDAWGMGTIKIEYYPLWIQGLKVEDLPIKTDFIQETYTNTPILKLKTTPLDPIRSVEQYKPENNEWIELTEDIDYHVEYPQKTVHIPKDFNTNTQYRVRYTPYLTDEGLALAYHIKRKDTNQQAIIQSCYFQNRV